MDKKLGCYKRSICLKIKNTFISGLEFYDLIIQKNFSNYLIQKHKFSLNIFRISWRAWLCSRYERYGTVPEKHKRRYSGHVRRRHVWQLLTQIVLISKFNLNFDKWLFYIFFYVWKASKFFINLFEL